MMKRSPEKECKRAPGGGGRWAFRLFLFLLVVGCILHPAAGRARGSSAEEEFRKGLDLYREKKFSEAAALFEKIEKNSPENLRGEALFMGGQAARALEKWPQAELLFSGAAKASPDLADYALFFRGEALRKMGDRERALQVFQELAQNQPQSLLIARSLLRMAEILLDDGDAAKAAAHCEQAVRLSGSRETAAQGRLLLAQAREKAEEWAEAARVYQEVWLRHPLHPQAKTARAKYEALQKEKKAPAVKISPEALFRRTQVLYQARLYDAALSDMERLQELPRDSYPEGYGGEPWIDEFYFQKGMIFFWRKKFPQADEALQLVLRNSRQKEAAEKAYYWRCRVLERLGRGGEVLKLADSFSHAYPGGSYGDRMLFLRAQILEEGGSLAEAAAAYREVAEKFPKGALVLQSLWKAGWLLFQNRDPEAAVRTWQALGVHKPASPWSEKALYWSGKALAAGGKTDQAEETFRRLRREFPAAYHTQLAIGGGGFSFTGKGFSPIRDAFSLPLPGAEPASGEVQTVRLRKGRLLSRLNLLPEAVEELEAVEGNGGTGEGTRLEVSRLFREIGEYHRSNLLVRRNFALRPLPENLPEKERTLYLLAYPVGDPLWINKHAENLNLDPALVSAVILEESRFDPQALSVSGARGLMQIMPATGKDIAKSLKIHPYGEQKLYDPELNIRFGSWYLARLLEDFGGKAYLAVAAYNAGPRAVRSWLARFPNLSEDEFVEKIPYAETRNYVVKVLTSRQVYKILYP